MDDLINSKIDLLEAQIEDLERSGFFTEAEIDRLSGPMKIEKEALLNLKLHMDYMNNLDVKKIDVDSIKSPNLKIKKKQLLLFVQTLSNAITINNLQFHI